MTPGLCRSCGTKLKHTFVDLGLSPLANSFIPVSESANGERFFPLRPYVCDRCFLVQLEEFESPSHIFSEYAYFSSYSMSWLRHMETYVTEMIRRFQLGPQSQVVEIASNDGYLLQYFIKAGVRALGIEPAANVARVAVERGVPTEILFFGTKTAEQLRTKGYAADLMVANNVLAHVPNILDFIEGFRILLKPQGVATFEFPHLLRMIAQKQFDTIYHEHFSYLSLGALEYAITRIGLRVFDVDELPTHGGSLRVFLCHEAAHHLTQPAVAHLRDKESAAGLSSLSAYAGFSESVIDVKCAALEFLIEARRTGKKVVGYGAAAKGNTFLNYCGIRSEFISVVGDRSPHKQKTLLPGSRIPVVSPEELVSTRPDYVLILPWNLKDEIASELAETRRWGARFVTAIPDIEIF